MNSPIYGKLCSLFYDAIKKYSPENEVSFYESFIPKGPSRILEAMSGSGRLQIPLMQRGYRVDGVDNSAIMLDRCRLRCAELGLRPELYEQSLESLSLPHCYDVVTIAVGSFQLITDRDAALKSLQNIRAHMYELGTLLVDIFIPELRQEPRTTRIARLDNRTIIRHTTRHIFYPETQRADALCSYELIIDGLVHETEDELIEVVWYTDEQFSQLLQEAGFVFVKAHDESFGRLGFSHIIQARAI